MELKRQLGIYDVVSISSGAMLSGLFILPGLAYAITGPGVLVSYLLAGLLALAGMLSQAELTSAMPKAGGAYFFVSRSMGPSVGTVYGVITWLSLCLKSAMELSAATIFAAVFLSLDMHIVAVGLCMVFLAINLFGVKEAGWIQSVFVCIIIAVLSLYVFKGLPHVTIPYFTPFAHGGLHGIVSGAGFLFVSFGGLLKIASIAEEVKDPGRIIPKGMMISLAIIVMSYVCVIFVTIGVVPPSELSGSAAPVSHGAGLFMGGAGGSVLRIIAILSILTAANAGIMAASRYPLALSRDGLLPEIFLRINPRFNTPHISIAMTGALIVTALFFNLEFIIKAASSVLILTYAFSCISIIIMRESRIQNYRPHFRSPLYPWVQIFGIFGFAALLFQIGIMSVVIAATIILMGGLLQRYYARIGLNREFALLHLIERLSERDYTDHVLETELKQIIHERDNISKDRFDNLIEECLLLDLDRDLQKDDFFDIVADAFAERLDIRQGKLKRMLLEREQESSTALSPFLAIPHVIIKGRNTFDILIARSIPGIRFSDEFPCVHAVFVLIGTRDTRHYHLQSLAAIAQIFQHKDFERLWLSAKNEKALRDILVLTERKRQE
ncbi:MAG TPA: amino acid permease [Deltaproteobacteria bacterium]|nr:amino acid permease [Deltaproteobacteria bacterium]